MKLNIGLYMQKFLTTEGYKKLNHQDIEVLKANGLYFLFAQFHDECATYQGFSNFGIGASNKKSNRFIHGMFFGVLSVQWFLR